MTGIETRGAIGGLLGGVSELLKNKAVLEAVIAGVGAFSAANKVKNKKTNSDGFDFSGILDMIPQMMPLLGLLTQSEGGIFGTSSPAREEAVTLPAFAETDSDSETDEHLEDETLSVNDQVDHEASEPVSNYNISYGSKKENRENLLLALRPFLSESRAAAADAIIQVNRISGFLG